MAFPIVNFDTRINYPDPRSMVVDWSGAFNNALNTFMKVQQFGLEKEYKEHLISQAEQTMQLERDKFTNQMHVEDVRLQLAQDQAEQQKLLNQSALRASDMQLKLNTLQFQKETQERDANAAYLESQNSSVFSRQQAALLDLDSFDPMQKEVAAQVLTSTSDEMMADPKLQLAKTFGNKAVQAELTARMNIVPAIDASFDKPIYRSERPVVTRTMQSADPNKVAALFGNSNFDALTPEQQKMALALQDKGEMKIVETSQPVMLSQREVMANLGKVDAAGNATSEAREAANILLRYTSPSNRPLALQKITESYRGNLGDLGLEKLAKESGASEDVLTALVQPSTWLNNFTTQLSSVLAEGKGPQDIVYDSENKPKMNGKKPLTYGDKVDQVIRDARKTGINPSDIEAAETFRDESWIPNVPVKTSTIPASIKPLEVSEAISKITPDMKVGEVIAMTTKSIAGTAIRGTEEAVASLPGISTVSVTKEILNKRWGDLDYSDFQNLAASVFPLSSIANYFMRKMAQEPSR